MILILGMVPLAALGPASASHRDSKIVGGVEISLAYIPFIASVQKKYSGHYCGGSMLTLEYVLTACHCLAMMDVGTSHEHVILEDASSIFVVAGIEDVTFLDESDLYFQRRRASRLLIHPKCDYMRQLTYDFGIIFLSAPFEENTKVQPFRFDDVLIRNKFAGDDLQVLHDETVCYVAGWGATAEAKGVVSKHLKAARMKIIPDEECAQLLSAKHTKFANYSFGDHSQMCALGYEPQGNSSDCVGDSGGPFYCDHTVYGTVSYGYECGKGDSPSVYANLASGLDWIESLVPMKRDDKYKMTSGVLKLIGRLVSGLVPSLLILIQFFLQ